MWLSPRKTADGGPGAARGRWMGALPLLLVLLVAGCDTLFYADGPGGAPSTVEIRLQGAEMPEPAGVGDLDPEALQSGAETFAMVNRVRVLLAGGGEVFIDEDVAVDASDGEIHLRFEFELNESPVEATLEIELFAGQSSLFRGEGPVTLERGRTATAELPLEGIGAGIRLPAAPAPLDALGDTVRLTGAVLFATGDTIPGVELEWHSLDHEIIQITSDGLATAIAEGEAEVEGVFETRTERLAERLTLRVEAVVAEVVISPSAVELDPGETVELEAQTLDRLGNPLEGRTVEWSSSDPAIVGVDDEGVITGLRPGEADVVASFESLTGTTGVTVRLAPPTIETLPATDVGSTDARLNARVDPRGVPAEIAFRWGTDPDLDDAQVTEPIEVGAETEAVEVDALLSGLETEVHYYFRAEVTSAGGEAVGETLDFVTTRPIPAPINLEVTWQGPIVLLEWDHIDPQGTSARIFEVWRAPVDDIFPPPEGWVLIDSTDIRGYLDEEAEPGNEWAYRIRACEAISCSPYSGVESVFVPMPAPSTIAGLVTLDSSPVSGMEVTLSGEGESRTTTTEGSGGYTFSELEAGTYQITLVPESADLSSEYFAPLSQSATVYGGGETVVLDFAGFSPPPAPVEFFVSDWRAGEVAMSWSYTSELIGEVTFEIDRGLVADSQPPTSWSPVGTSTTTEFADDTPEGNATWAYRVRACGQGPCSPHAAIDSANVPARAVYGYVRDESGNPVSGTYVDLVRGEDPSSEMVDFIDYVFTDQDGFYQITSFFNPSFEAGDDYFVVVWPEYIELVFPPGGRSWIRQDFTTSHIP